MPPSLKPNPELDDEPKPPEVEEVVTGGLTAEETAAAKAEAAKQFSARRKKQMRQAIIDRELGELERNQGAIVYGDHRDDIVSVRLHLVGAGGGKGNVGFDGAIIDGRKYQNGEIVTGTRAFVDGLLEMMWRSAVAQDNLDGKTRAEFYARQQPVEVTAAGARHVSDQIVMVT